MKAGAPPPAKKSLGQCFLVDQFFAQEIVAALQIAAGDVVIEIGPGRGVLTQLLVATPAEVIAVEIDNRLIEPLQTKFKDAANFRLLHEDFLDTTLAAIVPVMRTVKVVGNLPYHLAAEVIYKLMEFARATRGDSGGAWIERAVLMIQKEVAERVVAAPDTKAWGKLSVFAQLEGQAHMILTVPASAFRPEPKVDGGVFQLDFYRLPPVYPQDRKLLERTVRWCFSQRRKMLKRSLSGLPGVHPHWQNSALDFKRRPETLTPAEWVELTDIIAAAQRRNS
jgi:16S rRNA (adenine1518-N6/adenine1519-N6)-dimethyltransferase